MLKRYLNSINEEKKKCYDESYLFFLKKRWIHAWLPSLPNIWLIPTWLVKSWNNNNNNNNNNKR